MRALEGNALPESPNNSSPEGQEPSPLVDSISFTTWAICLPRWILRSRTDFAWHLPLDFLCYSLSSCQPLSSPCRSPRLRFGVGDRFPISPGGGF